MELDAGGIISLDTGNTVIFEQVFKTHFRSLHAYACTIVKDESTAEEMVQNVFYKLWEKKEQVSVTQSVNAYLYRSVYHECLNYIKHTKVRTSYQADAMHYMKEDDTTSKSRIHELEQKLQVALNELPEQCRTIFQMSRFDELKYREIADKLGLSVKTVENQMGKALKILRTKLAEFLPLLLILLRNL